MDRLLEEVEVLDRRGDLSAVEVTAVEFDSRRVGPGALFCCVPGATRDGHGFAAQAVERGAVGLLVERPLPLAVPQAVVGDHRIRPAMARVACALFGHPAGALLTVGVTGTNGKTTVSSLLAAILEVAGMPTLTIGTLTGERTTPEAPDLQRQLAAARDGGQRAAVVEVSSHALVQARVDGFRFSAAVFTNLGHDHLDFHGTREAYFEAKARLFTPAHAAMGVVNADDPWGQRLLEGARIPTVAFSASEATDIIVGRSGTSFTWRGRTVRLGLVGSYHVPNALAAATAARALGVDEDTVVAGLASAPVVPGRFEVVPVPTPFTVVVDYAHTPEGLEVALRSARELCPEGRVTVVFGCGGDRDRDKRPAMGAVAAAGADVVVVTSDNPRREDPAAIVADIVAGVPEGCSLVVEPDRRRAIELAIDLSSPGDVVLVAGKGHERAIEVGDRRVPFDDRSESAHAMARWLERAGRGGAGRGAAP